MQELKIDSEFHKLIPPLTDDERTQLEENILHDGIQDPLKVWNGILVDGHNRYEIAKAHNLPFTTTEMTFSARDDAIVWIIKNQFGRRNLSVYDRSLLALKLKPIIAAKAKEQQIRKPADFVFQNSGEQKPIRTDKELAKVAGVSHDTIAKVEKIEAEASPEIKAALKTGEMSVNAAFEGLKNRTHTLDDIRDKKPLVVYNSGNYEWYTPANIIADARRVMGTIDLDPASSETANQTVNAKNFFSADDDGLTKDWYGNIWLNPPYSTGLIEKFVDKLLTSIFSQALVLVNNATDTNWFCKLANCARAVVFPKGRVKFHKPDCSTGAPLQGQAIFYFGDNLAAFKEIFGKYGRCWL